MSTETGALKLACRAAIASEISLTKLLPSELSVEAVTPVISIGELSSRFLASGSRPNAAAWAAGDGVDALVAPQSLAVEFGKTVGKAAVGTVVAEVTRDVDDAQALAYLSAGEKFTELALGQTAEEHVYTVEVSLVGEGHVALADEATVYVADCGAGVRETVGPQQVDVGVVDDEADKFTCAAT